MSTKEHYDEKNLIECDRCPHCGVVMEKEKCHKCGKYRQARRKVVGSRKTRG